jgi:hypothetical protein
MRQIHGREIQRVLIVDDEPNAREGYTWVLADSDFEPVLEQGPLDPTPGEYAQRTASDGLGVQAALCDQRLGIRGNYASYLGAEIVKHWYALRFPAVLCTRFEDAAINDIRPLRRWIPALLPPDELHDDPEAFTRACDECIYEFDVGFRAHREPWRAQVVVADVDEEREHFWFEVPAWEHSARVRLRAEHIPEQIRVRLELDYRLFAKVNLGAERNEDLYFDAWELPE